MSAPKKKFFFRKVLGVCPKTAKEGATGIVRTDKRKALIEGAVRCIARDGVGVASTRDIAALAGVSDSHIYALFKDRDDLVNTAYTETSSRVVNNMIDCIRSLRKNALGMDFEACMRLVFHVAWRDLLDDPDVCRFLVYYYHSPLFMQHAYTDHHQDQLARLVALTTDYFGNEEETRNVIYDLVTQLYDFSIVVANGIVPDTEETENRYFEILYSIARDHRADR